MARESASINFDTVIIDQKGKAMEKCIDATNPCKKFVPITLTTLILHALSEHEPDASPEELIKRNKLFIQIYKSGNSASISADDLTLIKQRAPKVLTPYLSSQVLKYLK